MEPSSEPVFYNRSDVWNRHTNAPGAFDANNRPANQLPKNGPGIFGRNFAFARIRRRGTGAAVAVTAHFLVSRFGTGSNYLDAGTSADLVVNFAAANDAMTMAAGYRWQLPATSSSHLCLAVEVSTPQDPIVAPSLLGRAPGWPTTDLLVINDNNKAQRNMGIGPTMPNGFLTWFALVHNAATIRRDIVLEWERRGAKAAPGDSLQLVGGRPQEVSDAGRLVVPDLKPGESRFLRVTLAGDQDAKRDAEVAFNEMVGNAVVNGFSISAQTRPQNEVAGFLLQRALSVYVRAESFAIDAAAEPAKQARMLLKRKSLVKAYGSLVRSAQERDSRITEEIRGRLGEQGDPFGLEQSAEALRKALGEDDVPATYSNHGAFLEGIDAALTTLDIREGDLADVCQNLRWQAHLFRSERLTRVRAAKRVVSRSEDFVDSFAAREVTTKDYPKVMNDVLPALRQVGKALGTEALAEPVRGIRDAKTPKELQRRHWEYLDTLAGLV